MDSKAKAESCQLYIEQEITERQKKGKTDEEIGRELAKELPKLFEIDGFKPRSLAQRSRRMRGDVTDVTQAPPKLGTPKPGIIESTQAFITHILKRFHAGTSFYILEPEINDKLKALTTRYDELTVSLTELNNVRDQLIKIYDMVPLSRDDIKLLTHTFEVDKGYDILNFNDDSVYAFMGNFGVICKSKVEINGAVRGVDFLKALSKSQGNEMTFESTNKTINVRMGTFHVDLKTYPKKASKPFDFSNLTFKKLPNDFAAGVEACLPFVSPYEKHKFLTGLHINNDKLLACNNIAIQEYTLESPLERAFTIHLKACKIIPKLKPTEYCIHDGRAVFRNENSFLWAALMPVEYPAEDLIQKLDIEGTEYSCPVAFIEKPLHFKPFKEKIDKNLITYITVEIQEHQVILTPKEPASIAVEHEQKPGIAPIVFHVHPKIFLKALKLSTTFRAGKMLLFESGNTRLGVSTYGIKGDQKK